MMNETPNQDELKKRHLRCRVGTAWRERRGKFKQFLVRSLADKMDELGALIRTQQEYQEETWMQQQL